MLVKNIKDFQGDQNKDFCDYGAYPKYPGAYCTSS